METINDIDAIIEGIQQMHGCNAKHLESRPVHETFHGKTVWEGVVDVFEVDHPETTRAYGWSYEPDGDAETQHVAVLGKPPVTGPVEAVRAFIVAREKE